MDIIVLTMALDFEVSFFRNTLEVLINEDYVFSFLLINEFLPYKQKYNSLAIHTSCNVNYRCHEELHLLGFTHFTISKAAI